MIKTIEKIKLSETTTSYRVAIDDVNARETLDERYLRHWHAAKEREREHAPLGFTKSRKRRGSSFIRSGPDWDPTPAD